MPNFRRSTWTLIFFLALLAPFGAMFLLSIIVPPSAASTRPGSATAASQASRPLLGPLAPLVASHASAPIFAAGDEKTLWVAHPILLDASDKKLHAFELLERASNARTWTLIRDGNGNPYFQDYPSGLATFSPNRSLNAHAVAFVFNQAGSVQSYSASESTLQANLPPEQKLLATAGATGGVFALTSGFVVPGSGKPGEVLELARPALEIAASRPATTTSQPATVSRPAEAALVNAFWFTDGHWIILPPMGRASKSGAREAPGPGAHVALAQRRDRLIALWVDPGQSNVLMARWLEFKSKSPAWSEPAEARLGAAVPPESRLLPVLLDQTLYLLWPARAAGAEYLELFGGRISEDLSDPLPARNMLPPMSLRAAGAKLNPATDVAAGPAENSIVVVVSTPENTLSTFLFNNRGGKVAGPTLVQPQTPQRNLQVAQNLAILLVIAMLTLSFWQWRHRAGEVKLPPGTTLAKPLTRAFAFIIDMAIPYILVCLFCGFFGLWGGGGYYQLLTDLVQLVELNFDVLLTSMPLVALLALYLAHVTVGELFWGRSVGKALTGLRIIMVDGKAPTVAAIVLRNLIRLPELLLGLLVVYLFMSRNRQRLGDVVGRTLVIAQKPPEDAAGPHHE